MSGKRSLRKVQRPHRSKLLLFLIRESTKFFLLILDGKAEHRGEGLRVSTVEAMNKYVLSVFLKEINLKFTFYNRSGYFLFFFTD